MSANSLKKITKRQKYHYQSNQSNQKQKKNKLFYPHWKKEKLWRKFGYFIKKCMDIFQLEYRYTIFSSNPF